MNKLPCILIALVTILVLWCCWYLATKLRKTKNHLTKVKEELTKVKKELKAEKEAQMLEIQTKQFRIAEERNVQKLGGMVVLSPEEFSAWKKTPTEEIEQLIRNDMARQMANAIKPYIEIEMADFPDGYGNFRFMGQLSIAVREPKHIDFGEAFRMVGRDPEEAK